MSKLKLEWRENPDGSWKAQANRCHVTLTSEPSGFPWAVDGHEWEYRYTTPGLQWRPGSAVETWKPRSWRPRMP